MKKKLTLETTSTSLHIIAMVIMLIDHCKRIFPDVGLLPCIGRIAFPIFAFLIVEGYHHTRDLKKYAQRLLFFAILAEIPADLMSGKTLFYPAHQNVLWTFLIGLGLVHINEKAKQSGKVVLRILAAVGTVVAGCCIGMIARVDYSHGGVLTVLAFYFFRGRNWKNFLLQLVSLLYLNFAVMSSGILEFTLFGVDIAFRRQGLGVLALIPIWLYRGKQGYHSKWLQYLNYGFYPGHMLIIAVIIGTVSPAALLVFPAAAAVILVWRLMGEKMQGVMKRLFGGPIFWVAAAIATVALILAPYRYIADLPVDRVNVFYYQSSWAHQNGEYTSASFTDPKDIEAWIAFREEAAPEEKQTDFTAMASAYPHYEIYYINGSTVLEGLFVTQRESVFARENSGKGKSVGYTPLNPYFKQAGEMMGAQ